MKKVCIFSLLLSLVVCFALSTNAFAWGSGWKDWCKLDPINGTPYMSDSSGNPQSSFGLDEDPYVFLQFDRDDINTSEPLKTVNIWQFDSQWPSGISGETVDSFPTDPVNVLDTPGNWDSIKQVGEWNVYAAWWNKPSGWGCDKGGWGAEKLSFTVTPEPISSLLFFIGGAGLITRRFFRKK